MQQIDSDGKFILTPLLTGITDITDTPKMRDSVYAILNNVSHLMLGYISVRLVDRIIR